MQAIANFQLRSARNGLDTELLFLTSRSRSFGSTASELALVGLLAHDALVVSILGCHLLLVVRLA